MMRSGGTFSYDRVWRFYEDEYQREVAAGRKRDTRIVVGGLVVVILALWASIAFAGDDRSDKGGNYYGGSGWSGPARGQPGGGSVAYYGGGGVYSGGSLATEWDRFQAFMESLRYHSEPRVVSPGAMYGAFNGDHMPGLSGSPSGPANGYGYGGGPRGY
jgi:hypothetical protein